MCKPTVIYRIFFHLRHPPHLEHSLPRSNFETVCACVAAAPFAARAARLLDATASVVVHGILIQPLQQSLFDVTSYLLSLTSPRSSSPSPPLPHPSSLVSSQTIIEALKFITTGNHPAGGNGAAFVHDPKVRHVHKKLCSLCL